jgi:hypothetical protein
VLHRRRRRRPAPPPRHVRPAHRQAVSGPAAG